MRIEAFETSGGFSAYHTVRLPIPEFKRHDLWLDAQVLVEKGRSNCQTRDFRSPNDGPDAELRAKRLIPTRDTYMGQSRREHLIVEGASIRMLEMKQERGG